MKSSLALLIPFTFFHIVSAFHPVSELQQPLNGSTLAFNPSKHMLLTAVTHHEDPPHDSRIQCLNLTSHGFATYPTVGESVFLAAAHNVTYVVLPPRSAEVWHNPPRAMFFVLLSGQARVETPRTRQAIDSVPGGRHQLLLALDTRGRGHLTFYPGDTPTIALQIPLKDAGGGSGGSGNDSGRLDYEVVRNGPCRDGE